MNLNSNVRLLITTSPDADSTPQLWLKQSICLLKIQDNETNNEGWWPHLNKLGKTVFSRRLACSHRPNPHHLLILLHLLWCRPRRLTTLQRLIKMLNLWDFIDPTTKNSCICVKKFRQICLLFLFFFRVVDKFFIGKKMNIWISYCRNFKN
jgi:hypothetical protein